MRGIAAYRTSSVKSASQPQLVLLLYREAMRRLQIAEEMLEEGRRMEALPHLHHVREIVLELQGALDDSVAPELCGQLRGLYGFCVRALIAAVDAGEPQRVRDVLGVLSVLHEGWTAVIDGGVE